MELNTKKQQIGELNRKVSHCRLCRLSETRRNAVPSEGDPEASIMIIAQAPGRMEDQEGKMFIGPSGEVLDRLFESIGLERRQVYMTNLLKCFLPNCRKPRSDEIGSCSVYLDREIQLVNPELIVPLGYHPIKAILQKYGLEVPNRHRFPELFGKILASGRRNILPLRHPATVVHQSTTFDQLQKNYRKMKTTGNTCKWYEVCPIRTYYEQGKLNKKWIDQYCRGDWESCQRYQKEENSIPHPDNLLPDGNIDPTL